MHINLPFPFKESYIFITPLCRAVIPGHPVLFLLWVTVLERQKISLRCRRFCCAMQKLLGRLHLHVNTSALHANFLCMCANLYFPPLQSPILYLTLFTRSPDQDDYIQPPPQHTHAHTHTVRWVSCASFTAQKATYASLCMHHPCAKKRSETSPDIKVWDENMMSNRHLTCKTGLKGRSEGRWGVCSSFFTAYCKSHVPPWSQVSQAGGHACVDIPAAECTACRPWPFGSSPAWSLGICAEAVSCRAGLVDKVCLQAAAGRSRDCWPGRRAASASSLWSPWRIPAEVKRQVNVTVSFQAVTLIQTRWQILIGWEWICCHLSSWKHRRPLSARGLKPHPPLKYFLFAKHEEALNKCLRALINYKWN